MISLKECFVKKDWIISIQLDPFFASDSAKEYMIPFLQKFSAEKNCVFDINTSRRGIKQDSLQMASGIEHLGFTTIPHISPRDSLKEAVLSQALGAYTWGGVKNMLVVAGDARDGAYGQPSTKGIYETDSIGLISELNELRRDRKMTDLLIGCAFSQDIRYDGRIIASPKEWGRMQKKIAAGANFAMTQPLFYQKKEQRRRNTYTVIQNHILIPYLVGLWPFFSGGTASTVKRGEVAGVVLPDETYMMLQKNNYDPVMQAEWYGEMASELRKLGVAGVYIVTPFRRGAYDMFLEFFSHFCKKGGAA